MNDIDSISAPQFIGYVIEAERQAKELLDSSDTPVDQLRIQVLGEKSEFARISKKIREVTPPDRQQAGTVLNEVKKHIEQQLQNYSAKLGTLSLKHEQFFDPTAPGIAPPAGHLHIVTQAIMEITRIFERIGFTRVRHPEIDWDYYAFESLNMPPHHPARDEWETFFIEQSLSSRAKRGDLEIASPRKLTGSRNDKYGAMVLTPHTSNGQVREMEKGKLPVRMINIAKCYRRQTDVSHAPMFHQFEGMYIDKHVSIGDLKGVFDFFVKQFFGPKRTIRLRPFHFQFTEPSFEVDINCGICLGTGTLSDGNPCRLCKSGWLELGGSGMIHPNVLKNGGVDPSIYTGFAFGWGIERSYMMKSGTKLDDIRLLYGNDVRFLTQF